MSAILSRCAAALACLSWVLLLACVLAAPHQIRPGYPNRVMRK